MPPKQPVGKVPSVCLLAVYAAMLLVAFMTACGDDSMPAVPTPTIAVVEKSPTPSPTPLVEEVSGPSPIEVVSTGPPVSASTDVVTEEDLLNTSHPLEGLTAPEFTGLESWISSDPVTLASLQGKIILIDFWTYSCINCIRTLPFILEWQEKYEPLGLRIIGVHTPEFDFEKDAENVSAAVEGAWDRLPRCAGQRPHDMGRIRRHRLAREIPH